MTKAELARQAGMAPEAVRRLFTADGANPTAATLIALADALDVEIVARPIPRTARSSLSLKPPNPGLCRYRYTRPMASEQYSRHLLRMARRQAGLTQAALAQRARTSQAAISAYESGRRSPSVETLCRILASAGFDLRMRLATPDTHEDARRRAEDLLSSDTVAAFTKREDDRVTRVEHPPAVRA
jgi:transcriptional regulator with XRE-family HTH domain